MIDADPGFCGTGNMSRVRGKILRLLFVAAVILIACRTGTSPQDGTQSFEEPLSTESANEIDFLEIRDGDFVAKYPDWPDNEGRADENLVAVGEGGFGVWISRYEALPKFVAQNAKEHLKNHAGAELIASTKRDQHLYLTYRAPYEDQMIRSEVLFLYCQGGTYTVAVAGLQSIFDGQRQLFERVFESARCDDSSTIPVLSTGKLGMVVNPAHDDPLSGYYPALRLAKGSGVQVVHTYASWGDIEKVPKEFTWEWNDYMMGLIAEEGFEISLVVDVIHTTVRGEFPDDLENLAFDDPLLIERFTEFILALLNRFPGQVHYLSVGNEVNDYFVTRRDEIGPYRTFFLAVKNAIQAAYPDVQVGMTFAYHDAETQGALDIIEELNLGDFVPYTLYLYSDRFQFDRDPTELHDYLTRMLAQAGEKPVAFVELGWSTAARLGGSYTDQEAFIRQVFQGLGEHRERITYLTWFSLHDGTQETCNQAALSFIPDRPDLAQDETFMRDFVDYLCFIGLRENDGTPKPGWFAWEEEATTYLERYGSE